MYCDECGMALPEHAKWCNTLKPGYESFSDTIRKNLGARTEEVRTLTLQVRELWALIDSIPSGPGDGMVALSEDINEGLNWADRYRAAKARWKPVAQKPKGVCTHNCLDKDYSTGHTLCMKELPCPDHDEKKPKSESEMKERLERIENGQCPECGEKAHLHNCTEKRVEGS